MSGINGGPNQQPANWRYSIAQGGLSLASYPGNVQFDGIVFDDVSMFGDVASVQSANIPSIVTSFTTAGYYAPADGGGAQYRRVAGNGPGRIQSQDGQWWQPVFPLYPNVRAFGARGNGTANDAPAFQAAADYGGSIYCPPGNYSIQAQVNITQSDTTFFGSLEGSASVSVITISGAINCFNVTGAFNCSFWGLKFFQTGASGSVLRFAAGEFHAAYFCQIENTDASNVSPMIYFRSSQTVVDNCYFTGASANQFAVECDRTAGLININSIISSSYFGGAMQGVLVRTSDASPRPEGVAIRSNTFICTGPHQIEVREVLGIRIVDNMIDQGNAFCICLAPSAQNVEAVIISDNYIATAQNPIGPTGGVAVGILRTSVGNVIDLIVSNNTIEFSGFGIALNNRVDGPQIIGNKFSTIDQIVLSLNQCTNAIVTGNRSRNCVGADYLLVDDAAGGPFIVTGNHFRASGANVLTITNPAQFEFNNNFGRRFSGWASTQFAAAGTSTFVNVAHGLVLAPNAGKITVGIVQASGAHTGISYRIVTIDNVNITFEVFYNVVSAGSLRINVFCSI